MVNKDFLMYKIDRTVSLFLTFLSTFISDYTSQIAR